MFKRHDMELVRAIFNYARDGELDQLKLLLDNKPKEEVQRLVSAKTSDSTPLVMACINGHLEVALYLIEECRADIEQVGCVTSGANLDEAPPLWCAAAAGHLNLVKCLLRHKASVNSSTKTSSTSLRAACFNGHFEIARYLIDHGADIEIANFAGHTCLMIACFNGHYEISKYLVECGADINRKCAKGRTALHDCAESGNFEMLKLLLQNGAANISDSRDETPLLIAALIGHVAMVEYFIQEFNCSKQEKIDALELLGAFYIDENLGMYLARDFWRRSMILRNEDRDCLIEKPKVGSLLASYLHATEIKTLSQLEAFVSDPDEMKMQALLVRERILGPCHPHNLYYICRRVTTYARNGDFDRCVQLSIHALRMKGKPKDLLNFLEQFSRMMSESLPFAGGYYPALSFPDILCIFERVFKEIKRTLKIAKKINKILSNHTIGILFIALYLVGLMCRLQPLMNQSEELELKEAAYKLVQLNPRLANDWTCLHFACFKAFLSLDLFMLQNSCIQSEVVNLLLEVGAPPNALDVYHNTPLHIAARNKSCPRAVFNSLLNHGAHLDQCNLDKQTPLMLTNLSGLYPLHHINLQCLSAKAVQTHKIAYKGIVQKKLEVFLDYH